MSDIQINRVNVTIQPRGLCPSSQIQLRYYYYYYYAL
jgi:hypothetical protein